MNPVLTNQIVNHIFENLGLFAKRKLSINSPVFASDKKLPFVDDIGNEQLGDIWSCHAKIDDGQLAIICTDLSSYQENESRELAVIIGLSKCPFYGCYLSKGLDGEISDGLIALSNKSGIWAEADIYLQATFLGGMERLKGNFLIFEPLPVDELLGQLKDFLNYRDKLLDTGE